MHLLRLGVWFFGRVSVGCLAEFSAFWWFYRWNSGFQGEELSETLAVLLVCCLFARGFNNRFEMNHRSLKGSGSQVYILSLS